MDLIKRLYESYSIGYDDNTFIYFHDLDDVNKVMKFLKDTRCFSTDLSYDEFDSNLVKMFNELGFGNSSICLHNMVIGKSKFNKLDDGCCVFNYSIDSLEYNHGDILCYYSSNELFNGDDARCPGVQLISGNSSLYYSVGIKPHIKKYEIKVNDDLIITREFSQDVVLFILDSKNNGRFVIKIDKPTNKAINDSYILNNELELVENLKNIKSYDIVGLYNLLSEITLGNNISIYPEITISEMVNTECGVRDKNLLTIKDGRLDCAIRTIGDKTLTLHGNGDWSYVIDDECVKFRINSGKTFKYVIETKDNKFADNYVETLLSYDVSKAREEIETTKKLVKALGIGVKKGR